MQNDNTQQSLHHQRHSITPGVTWKNVRRNLSKLLTPTTTPLYLRRAFQNIPVHYWLRLSIGRVPFCYQLLYGEIRTTLTSTHHSALLPYYQQHHLLLLQLATQHLFIKMIHFTHSTQRTNGVDSRHNIYVAVCCRLSMYVVLSFSHPLTLHDSHSLVDD